MIAENDHQFLETFTWWIYVNTMDDVQTNNVMYITLIVIKSAGKGLIVTKEAVRIKYMGNVIPVH